MKNRPTFVVVVEVYAMTTVRLRLMADLGRG